MITRPRHLRIDRSTTLATHRENPLAGNVPLRPATVGFEGRQRFENDARVDRRGSVDRRRDDVGPPGAWKERRRFADRRMIAVTEISFTDWFSCWDRWFMNRASTPSEGLDVPRVDARRESDRRKAEWAMPQHGRERRYTAERRMIEVREVGLDQWLCSIDSNLQLQSPP